MGRKLRKLANYKGDLDVDGEKLPWYEPVNPMIEFMEFDRTMCELGIIRFVRPCLFTEIPTEKWKTVGEVEGPIPAEVMKHHLAAFFGNHLTLVSQIFSGGRSRMLIEAPDED